MRRVLSSAFVFAVVASATAIAAAAPASACSCGGTELAFENADAVFIGQVDRDHPARDGGSVEVAIVQVSDVFKGDVDRLQGVASPVDGASCGYHLDVDGIYLIFATSAGLLDLEPGFYETNLCSGTRLIDDSDLGFDAPAYAPNDAGPPTAAEIKAQLGDPRSSLFPEAFIFVGVLGFILGLAAWFSRKNRPAI